MDSGLADWIGGGGGGGLRQRRVGWQGGSIEEGSFASLRMTEKRERQKINAEVTEISRGHRELRGKMRRCVGSVRERGKGLGGADPDAGGGGFA